MHTSTPSKMLPGTLLLATAGLLAALAARPSWAASGDLDSTFGTGGVVTLSPAASSIGYGVAVQSDGQILAAGYASGGSVVSMIVVRVDSSGVPDPAFGTNGVATVSTGVQSLGFDVAIQPTDNKILVTGGVLTPLINEDFQTARLLPADGQLDPTFGSGGIVTTQTEASSGGALAVAVQSDGKILVGGNTARNFAHVGRSRDFLVVRYLTDGTLDPGFGDGGRATTRGARYAAVQRIVVQPDGPIVTAGTSAGRRSARFVVARLNAYGAPDTSFASGGRFRRRLVTAQEYAMGVALLPDGRILAGGVSREHDLLLWRPTLAQLTPSGILDPTFDADGVASLAPDPLANRFINAMVRQADGKIVVAGGLLGPTQEPTGGILLVRFLDDGSLDTSFGSGGFVNTVLGDQGTARGIALQADGGIVIAGNTVSALHSHLLIARYLP